MKETLEVKVTSSLPMLSTTRGGSSGSLVVEDDDEKFMGYSIIAGDKKYRDVLLRKEIINAACALVISNPEKHAALSLKVFQQLVMIVTSSTIPDKNWSKDLVASSDLLVCIKKLMLGSDNGAIAMCNKILNRLRDAQYITNKEIKKLTMLDAENAGTRRKIGSMLNLHAAL